MPTVSNPKHPHGEWFEELCALAAIGELSSSEGEELQRHLGECPACRQLYADFRRISAHDLGLMAVQKWGARQSEEFGGAFDEQELFARVRERALREGAACDAFPSGEAARASSWRRLGLFRAWQWLHRPALYYAATALLLCAVVGAAAYLFKEAQLSPMLASLHFQVKSWESRAAASEAQKQSLAQQLRQRQAERETLLRSLREAQARYADLQARQEKLETEIAAARVEAEQRGREADSFRAGVEERSKQIADLQTRLQTALQRTEEQRKIAETLRNRLDAEEQAAGIAPEPRTFSDAEAKNLFGARDLHIVDVYDVDGKGKTKRTYGRVFYVEKKLLIFYAFDLGDKQRNRAPAGFQAWGYRQPNESKPENLGLFTVDDPSLNRWVLEVNNPRVLEHIDAVFVTLESPTGSPSPRGRRLLYANLAVPANHP